jgi:hypothetical protein
MIPFAVGGGEIILLGTTIQEYTAEHGDIIKWICVVSIIVFLVFSCRMGYKFFIYKLRLPRRKSVTEHLEILWNGVVDAFSCVLTLVSVFSLTVCEDSA